MNNVHNDNSKPGKGRDPGQGCFQLRLFVAGSTARSQQAIQNIRRICEEHLQGQYSLEVIDVSQHPEQARNYRILAVPTLLKELPLPLRKVVGDLSQKEKVLQGLDIKQQSSE